MAGAAFHDRPSALPDPHLLPEFYADVPLKRFGAFVVDTVVIALLSLVVVAVTAFVGLLVFPLVMLAVGFAYRVVTLARGSATWGMRLMAIKFRTWQGKPFDPPSAALHTLGYTLCWVFPLLQLVSVVLMLVTERRQGLVDLAMGSVCLNRSAPD